MPKRSVRQAEASEEGEAAAKKRMALQPDGQGADPARTQNSTPMPLRFWPGSHHRGLPLELRLKIYDDVATTAFAQLPPYYNRGPKMFYEYNAYALALIRNGTAWENDAAASLKVPQATEAVGLLADAASLNASPFLNPRHCWLSCVLGDMGIIHSIDQERQQAFDASKPWSAPIAASMLIWGDMLMGGGCRMMGRGHLTKGRNAISAKQLAQTVILQLRRNPVVRVRIFLDECLPSCRHESDMDGMCIVANVMRFLGKRGRRHPRRAWGWIRIQVTLITRELRLARWKEELGDVVNHVEWDVVSKDELAMFEVGARS